MEKINTVKPKPSVTIGDYEMLKRCQEENKWAGFQSNVPCRLGCERAFQVKDTEIEVKAICIQIGGAWTGRYTYRVDEILK